MLPLRLDYRKILLLAVLVIAVVYRNQVIASLLPFALAFILAAMIEPIIVSIEKRTRLPRSAAVLLTLVTLIVVAGYLASVVTAKVAAELVELGSKLPTYQRELIAIADTLISRANELYEYLPSQASIYLQSTINDLSHDGVIFLRDLIDRSLRAIGSLPAVMVVVIVTVLATYFLSRDREQLTNTLFRLAPARWQVPLRDAQEKIVVDLIGFLKAQFIIFMISTVISIVGLYYIGTRFWMILGIALGILDIIPIVGPGLILFPWAGLSVAMGDLRQALLLCVLFVVILVAKHAAQAKVLGDSVGVHPLAMLIAVYAGIVVFGIMGMIIGPVLVIIGKAFWASGLLLHLDGERRGIRHRQEVAERGGADRPPGDPPPPVRTEGDSRG